VALKIGTLTVTINKAAVPKVVVRRPPPAESEVDVGPDVPGGGAA